MSDKSLFAALFFLLLFIPGGLYAAENDPIFSFALPSFATSSAVNSFSSNSSGIALDSNGRVYIAEGSNGSVEKYDSDGKYYGEYVPNSITAPAGYVSGPQDVAIDSNGNLYVMDKTFLYVSKFNSSGTYVTRWGSVGSGNGAFNNSRGIAVDSSNNVYVTDTGNSRIQKFDSSGNYLLKFGSSGTGNGQFSSPQDVAVDSDGNIYVVDTGNERIQKFNSSGTYVTQWGSEGTGNGQFGASGATGIAIDSSNGIYVVDGVNNTVQKFDTSGNFVAVHSGIPATSLAVNQLYNLAVGPDGNIYVLDLGRNMVRVFNSSLVWVDEFGEASRGFYDWPHSIAEDSNGNFYVTERDNARIQKLDSSLNFAAQWSSISSAGGIWIDSNDNVYVVQSNLGGCLVKKFNTSGTLITSWGTSCSVDDYFLHPIYIAVDSQGYVYVADDDLWVIKKFTSGGTYVTEWGGSGTEDGKFYTSGDINLRGLAIDNNDLIYAVDQAGCRVQVFNTNGTFIRKWGTCGSGDGQFGAPAGIAVDNSGNVYVGDWNRDLIQKFSNTGEFISSFGANGSGAGQFNNPRGLFVDSQGRLWIMDSTNNRIHVYLEATSSIAVSQIGTISSMTEGGSGGSYTFTMSGRRPSATTTIWFSSEGQIAASPSEAIFTPSNWETPQTIQVNAFDDSKVEGNHTATLRLSVTSTDPAYSGYSLSISSVSISITDNDFAGGGGPTSGSSGIFSDGSTSGGGGGGIFLSPAPAPSVSVGGGGGVIAQENIPRPVIATGGAVNNRGDIKTLLGQLAGPFRMYTYTEKTKVLQEILSLDQTIYPEGLVTGYYGPLTRRAIERFQEREGIINHGTPETTGFGYAGPKTRGALAVAFGGGVDDEACGITIC